MKCPTCFYNRYGNTLPCYTCGEVNKTGTNNWLEDLTPKESGPDKVPILRCMTYHKDITLENYCSSCEEVDSSIMAYIKENTPSITQKQESLRASPSGDVSKSEALRLNEGKTPYAHLPLDLLDGASRVMEAGSKKYSRNNFRKGYEDLYSPLNSVIRHLVYVQQSISSEDKLGDMGLLLDKETGEAHIHHLVTSVLILIHAMRIKEYKV